MDMIKKLDDMNTVVKLMAKVQRGEIFTALDEIDQILLNPLSSQWLIDIAISQQTTAYIMYSNLAFETSHPELFNKGVR